LYYVATTAEFPYDVCGAQQDDGTACVPSGRAFNMRALYSAGGGEAGYVAPDPKDPNIFYGGDQAGIITRYDRRTGATRSITVYPLFFSGMPASALKERWQWTFPIVFSPVDPRILYTSSQHLFRTDSQGQRWESISPDLTRNDPATLGDSGGPITKDQNGPEIYGTIFSIAPSRHDMNTIWTGSDDGLVYVTRDGGKHWSNVTPPEMGSFNRVSMIEASPNDPACAYVAAKRYQMDDRAPYIFKTHDYGKTWAKIIDGIGATDFAQAVREDPRRAGLLYAGTEHGIYVSFDDGAHWRSLSLNLPDTQVSDIVVEKDDLVIATHGRSFWILDDIGPLRQYAPEVTQAPAHLFEPRVVTRSVTPAVIDYYLSHAAETVTLQVLDSQGRVIPTKQVAGRAGLNRFVWNLRYPGAVTFPGIVLRYATPGQGPIAPPGEYSVRLVANGITETKRLTIRRDPRATDLTDADLEEQFRLAMAIQNETERAHGAILQVRSIREQLKQRAATDAGAAQLASGIESKLDEIEQDLYQTRNRSPRDTLNYPIKLNNQLAVLEHLVDMGDQKPTDQDYTVFEELKAHLNQILSRFDAVVASDLPPFNQRMESLKLAPVKPN
jgi:hypothetical protein